MTNEPTTPDNVTSLEDMRADADRALGGPPDPARWKGDPDDPLLTEGAPENMEDGQTAPGFEPDDLTEDEMAERDATPATAAEAFPEPEPDAEVEHAAAEFAALSAGPKTAASRAEMPDGQTRTAAQMEENEAAEQGSFLPPDVPAGHLAPPHADAIANETWHLAGDQFASIVRDVLDFDEFQHLAEFTHMTIWHRQGRPQHPWADLDGERTPMLAKVEIVPPQYRWLVNERESPDALPHFVLGLYYQHFHALREEGLFYHRDQIAMQVHLALSVLSSDSGILTKAPPAVVVWKNETLERYGFYSAGLRALQKPMLPFMKDDILQTPGFGVE